METAMNYLLFPAAAILESEKALGTVVPKSYRPKGQPRSTRKEFPIRADFGNLSKTSNMAAQVR